MRVPDIRTKPTTQIEIPVQFSRLRDIAYNLSWSWSQPTRELFYLVDPVRWRHYRNPIELLIDLEPERWHTLQRDESFIRTYRAVVEEFDLHMAPDEATWFDSHYPGYDGGPIAYFSTEYGWHGRLATRRSTRPRHGRPSKVARSAHTGAGARRPASIA